MKASLIAKGRCFVVAMVWELWRRPWIGILFAFLGAAWLRWMLPTLPLADPDTRGYLSPALQHLAGHGMVQAESRGLAYPLLLRGILGTFGSFPSIVITQHVLGLFSGVLWLVAFGIWLGCLPTNKGLLYASWWMAAVGVAVYLGNPATLVFETQIRPEAVFPFFCLAQIAAMLFFLRFRWIQPHFGWMIFFAGLAGFFAAICLSLKPSWGLAALIPFGMVLGSLFIWDVRTYSLALRGGPLLAMGAAFVLWNVGVPRLVGWIPNPASGEHLAGTLFTVHADIISQEMHRRAARGELDSYEEDFLRKLDERLGESQRTGKYATLGHDPDFLLYRSDALRYLPHVPKGDLQQGHRYLRHAYLRAVVNEPWLMFRKITRQIVKGYADASKSVFNSSMQWKVLFPTTSVNLSEIALPEIPCALAENYQQTLNEIRASTELQPEVLRAASWFPPQWFFYYAVTWLQAASLVTGAVAFILTPWLLRQKFLRRLAAGFWGAFIVWGCSVGSALTVSIIHSFDIDRYVRLQSSVNILLLVMSFVFVMAVLQAFRTNSAD